MELLCQTLTFHHIPFNLKHKKDNIIIIPNGVIKVKNFQTIRNKTDIMDYIKQLNNLSSQYNMPVFGFNINIDINSFINYHDFYQFINSSINIDTLRIKVCSSLDEIIVGDYCYAIRNTGAIWTLVTLFDNFYPIIQNTMIIITSETYKRAIIIMNDIELEFFHKFNINIIEGDINNSLSSTTNINTISIIYITQDTFRERELFTFKIDYVPLNGGNRSPCRIIDGITTICPNCSNIVYINNINDGTIRKHKPCN
jgi:hypothetical protein